MEVFNPPPYREKRKTGRPSKLTEHARQLVAQKVLSKEMTYREAAQAFGISPGAVATCVKKFKNGQVNSRRTERRQEQNIEVANYRHEAQLKELKQEIAELYLENQMLKKFLNKSLTLKKENGSVITSDNLAQSQRDAE